MSSPSFFSDLWARIRRRESVRRFLYNVVGGITPGDVEWHLMNFGYAPPEDDAGMNSSSRTATAAAESPEKFGLQMYERVRGKISLSDRDVLEIGCGRGGGAAYLAAQYGPRSFLALDFAPKLVERCQQTHDLPNLEFRVGNAMALDLPSESCDHVFNVESSHCYDDKPAFWREVRRVLRHGGYFHYADDFRPRAWKRTRRELEGMGFELIDIEDVTPGVLRAMDQDAERRRTLIGRYAPRWLRHEANDWAGLPGSAPYERFSSGKRRYMRCIARRRD